MSTQADRADILLIELLCLDRDYRFSSNEWTRKGIREKMIVLIRQAIAAAIEERDGELAKLCNKIGHKHQGSTLKLKPIAAGAFECEQAIRTRSRAVWAAGGNVNTDPYELPRCFDEWPEAGRLEVNKERLQEIRNRASLRGINLTEQYAADTTWLQAELAAANERADHLQKFKDWTHAYLDAQGVPHHPPGPHGAEGCRIGDRMDWLVARMKELEMAFTSMIEYVEGMQLTNMQIMRIQPTLERARAALRKGDGK